jgi:hypothetical protein
MSCWYSSEAGATRWADSDGLRSIERLKLPVAATNRGGGRTDEALLPLRGDFTRDVLRRLVLAIRSASGVEACVWFMDVAGLSSADAMAVMRWSARAMFRAALAKYEETRGPGQGL